MRELILPEGYSSSLTARETQKAIKFIKDDFQKNLSTALNLERMSAPIIVTEESGINDDLNGVERKVHFTAKMMKGNFEVVQSLAKWKRMALYRFGYEAGEGIYTDMNAIRRDDDMDNIHSVFVDQWDWEKVITKEDRNFDFLKSTVKKIVSAICDTSDAVKKIFPAVKTEIKRDVFFITASELEEMYPDLSPKEREDAVTEKYKTVFLMQIGGALKNGKPHDGRAPDYDDWTLNGDLLFYNEVLGHSFEVSSMGIRVDAQSLKTQLALCNKEERLKFDYHKKIIDNVLPLTIGGGIGQSRMCMLLLSKAHVGEVQASVWPEEMKEKCEKHNIFLL